MSSNSESDLRQRARLPFSATVLDAGSEADEAAAPPLRFEGYTQDLRASGLSLVVPYLFVDKHDLSNHQCVLRIILHLPSGSVDLKGRTVRHEKILSQEGEQSFLIGVRITDMTELDCVRFVKYLRTLH
ncbi:MAG: PilZ domain-containing protein [Pyrinomonadaceae bacterium]